MDIKKILITDDISEKVVESLKAADLIVDYSNDISVQKLLEVVHVSETFKLPN